jgi:hypothetical protein
MPIYEYAVRVHPWGQKLGRNIRGRVWVPANDEDLAEERVRDDLHDRYRGVAGEDIVSVSVSIIEDVDSEIETQRS